MTVVHLFSPPLDCFFFLSECSIVFSLLLLSTPSKITVRNISFVKSETFFSESVKINWCIFCGKVLKENKCFEYVNGITKNVKLKKKHQEQKTMDLKGKIGGKFYDHKKCEHWFRRKNRRTDAIEYVYKYGLVTNDGTFLCFSIILYLFSMNITSAHDFSLFLYLWVFLFLFSLENRNKIKQFRWKKSITRMCGWLFWPIVLMPKIDVYKMSTYRKKFT